MNPKYNTFKKSVKYTAIGLATAYVVATGCAELRSRLSSVCNTSACQELYQKPQGAIELNMANVPHTGDSAPKDGTSVSHPTLDTLLCPIGQPLEEE